MYPALQEKEKQCSDYNNGRGLAEISLPRFPAGII
jgi:hypothetical protein